MTKDEYDPKVSGSAAHVDAADEPETVVVYPPEGQMQATAQALLDAADDPADVRFTDGGFEVPAKLADKAKLPKGDVEVASSAHTIPGESTEPTKAPAKATPRKAAAKKAPARKAAR